MRDAHNGTSQGQRGALRCRVARCRRQAWATCPVISPAPPPCSLPCPALHRRAADRAGGRVDGEAAVRGAQLGGWAAGGADDHHLEGRAGGVGSGEQPGEMRSSSCEGLFGGPAECATPCIVPPAALLCQPRTGLTAASRCLSHSLQCNTSMHFVLLCACRKTKTRWPRSPACPPTVARCAWRRRYSTSTTGAGWWTAEFGGGGGAGRQVSGAAGRRGRRTGWKYEASRAPALTHPGVPRWLPCPALTRLLPPSLRPAGLLLSTFPAVISPSLPCRGPEYQAEVGLLSRYILVQVRAGVGRAQPFPGSCNDHLWCRLPRAGAASPSCRLDQVLRALRPLQGDAASERTRRGVHIRVEGAARIRGVQAYRAGQVRRVVRAAAACSMQGGEPKDLLVLALPSFCGAAPCSFALLPCHAQNNVLGAYPFHWHFAGDASGQMATDNSVYRRARRSAAAARRRAGPAPAPAVAAADPLPAATLAAAAVVAPAQPAAPRRLPSLPPCVGPSTAVSPSTPPTTCCSRTTWASTSPATASTSRWAGCRALGRAGVEEMGVGWGGWGGWGGWDGWDGWGGWGGWGGLPAALCACGNNSGGAGPPPTSASTLRWVLPRPTKVCKAVEAPKAAWGPAVEAVEAVRWAPAAALRLQLACRSPGACWPISHLCAPLPLSGADDPPLVRPTRVPPFPPVDCDRMAWRSTTPSIAIWPPLSTSSDR